ncbi:hypothetical protein GUJ93_ZPchr0006g43844 [Zizania palustris]|uniref:Uncharacterized protein n=1 Tax=Zizania palustris TaxID=103762 RepID=A0A8J5T483_ZIZPA|nr:hypothetical protein GUJ93_ZPchr0006g43844 [Zizania palustris]
MLVGMEGQATAAAGSGCSSGCQSGWTTYLDDHSSSYSCGTSRFHGKAQQPYYYCDYSEDAEEDDLSMISDASSGPRQQYSTSNDEATATAVAHANAAKRRGRRMEAAARQQSKTATSASHLEDTASSPAFFKYTNSSADGNGYGCQASPAMEMGNAADFSCAFSATTGFETPLNGIPLGSYLQMQYSSASAKPMATRQVCRGGVEKKRR